MKKNNSNLIPFKINRPKMEKGKKNTIHAPQRNEWGELSIKDTQPPRSKFSSGFHRFFSTMVILLLIVTFLILAFY